MARQQECHPIRTLWKDLVFMSRKFLALSAAAATALALTACGDADADESASGTSADTAAGVCAEFEPLRFSDTGVEGLETLVLEFEDFRVALEEATGLDVEFEPMASRTAAATALEYDDLDVLLTGPAEYVVLKEEADAMPWGPASPTLKPCKKRWATMQSRSSLKAQIYQTTYSLHAPGSVTTAPTT
jgi:ABC-type phosphate/phosphonate transport system substrate-binding protein